MNKTEKIIKAGMKIYEQAGLVQVGKNKEGEMEYIGTVQQWDKAKELAPDPMDLSKEKQEIEERSEDNEANDYGIYI